MLNGMHLCSTFIQNTLQYCLTFIIHAHIHTPTAESTRQGRGKAQARPRQGPGKPRQGPGKAWLTPARPEQLGCSTTFTNRSFVGCCGILADTPVQSDLQCTVQWIEMSLSTRMGLGAFELRDADSILYTLDIGVRPKKPLGRWVQQPNH